MRQLFLIPECEFLGCALQLSDNYSMRRLHYGCSAFVRDSGPYSQRIWSEMMFSG